jgi:hypothetical protein
MPLIEDAGNRFDPLAVVERMASQNSWPFSRTLTDEIMLAICGKWTDYQVSFSWIEDIEVLHLACGFEMKIPQSRFVEVLRLLAGINEQLWMGHFEVWGQSGLVLFRHALLLIGGGSTSTRQCEATLGTALDSCERYFPALQFVVWAGKSAREALDVAMVATAGEA